ncbi:MAG: sulfotransferase, partial [Gemmatimonadota bacterium]|nr:sulfotransferase [Gemmatimonadota bacterium]
SEMDFATFLKTRFDSDRPPSHSLDVLAEPQTRFLTDFDGNLLVDFVGRFERLEHDFAEVCRRTELPRLQLPHRRKAVRRRDYRTYYSDALAEFVAHTNAPDIERFGYTFDPAPD